MAKSLANQINKRRGNYLVITEVTETHNEYPTSESNFINVSRSINIQKRTCGSHSISVGWCCIWQLHLERAEKIGMLLLGDILLFRLFCAVLSEGIYYFISFGAVCMLPKLVSEALGHFAHFLCSRRSWKWCCVLSFDDVCLLRWRSGRWVSLNALVTFGSPAYNSRQSTWYTKPWLVGWMNT